MTGIYTEDGARMRVEVLEDKSSDEEEAYLFKVIEMLAPHPICGDAPVGAVFEARKVRDPKWQSYCWQFSKADVTCNEGP